ncbi:rifamycin-inactivating phosphotransferase [Amycolatopsis sp. 195334CR]|uniref:rifamycin-inactivating phosphotransferase n=1 Tax=Amycolatopsis sp. 195334CR TaxID=2814588 RepID=UPI0027DE7EBE|nr:rifamycin-inactivating phosphotransferase [Amycolatopsis sp. 195334CR]
MLGFEQIDRTTVAEVGGKGAHLGELSRTGGVRVPAGFCVTTDAYRRILASVPSIDERLDRLSALEPDDHTAISALSAEIRGVIEDVTMPAELVAEIGEALARLGDQTPCAVRSSATAEDLPTASFAGQQDSYLNITGPDEILRHIRRCWASLFTDRAVTYRLHHRFDHRDVLMAVVVQRMVFPEVAGILFTADPITSNRKVATVEASWGLGEALVSGLVNADVFTVRDDQVLTSAIATKRLAVHVSPDGGTRDTEIAPDQQTQPTLTEAQVLELVRLGRNLEQHFGRPQDIEWCLAGGEFHIVQSRPITTLFPLPETGDQDNHVYVSVGHQQMMTDPMRPLGLSLWQLTTPREMHEAGGRLFVDVAPMLATPTGRAIVLGGLGGSDPLMGDALQTVLDRGDFIPSRPDENTGPAGGQTTEAVETDPAVVTELIAETQASVATLRREIETRSGTELIDFILADIGELRRVLFSPRSSQVIVAVVEATNWLNENLADWLGEKNAVDVLSQSVPHNITSEMGLALLDVADAIRPHAEVVAFLQQVVDEGREDFLGDLAGLDGGRAARDAIQGYLDDYGMRCAGEIDITRTRWSERPAMLVPAILGNIRNFEPGAGKQRFEQGFQEAQRKEHELLTRLRALHDGEHKAAETKRMIDRLRTFAGFREYPKYGMVCRYFSYKQALLREAGRLVEAGVLRDPDDVFYLRLQEFHEVVRTKEVDHELILERRQAFQSYGTLTPPRVLTSDGEALTGEYRRDDVPDGALAGMAVSGGTVEGRARVVLDMADAELEPGDILVTAYTDPSWTPLFVAIAGLVTEVGGLMTHGAVVAREYGLPAVVGVDQATRLIEDGQRIRVHGTEGYVEFLS